jgi:hypothetical protein
LLKRSGLVAALLLVSGTVVALSIPSATAATVGATTPFASYEAEAGTLGGGATTVSVTAAPTTQYSSAALEASGHAYVQLTGTGQYVRWTNSTGHAISFVNVRASMPDSASGGGTTATLNLYVNGTFRQALNLNSKQSWLYEGVTYKGQDQNPAHGSPFVFYDESHAFITGAAVAAGSTITLQKDSANTAARYFIDVIDVENPPAPLAQPANSISITSCGAVSDPKPTNGSADSASVDSTTAIKNCITQAQSQGKVLWIPSGTFYLKGTSGLQATGITIAGAGMWYSTIYRSVPLPNSNPPGPLFHAVSSTLQNFHLDSNATSRATVDGVGGSMDMSGTNWAVTGMWAEHNLSGIWGSGTGGKVSNSRFDSMWADGVNLNNVAGSVGDHLTATNNFIRGTGDDGMAINSVNYNVSGSTTVYYTPMNTPTMTNNTVIAVWDAHGIGVYGGGGDIVQNNYISDTGRFTGLSIGQFSANGSHITSATVSGNMIVRSGGNVYNQGQPALRIGIDAPGQQVGDVANVTVTGNTIINSMYDAVGISSSNASKLTNNTITSPWRNGIVISPPFLSAPTGSATITGNTVTGLKSGASAYLNNSTGFNATVSNNSWQGVTPTATQSTSGTVSLRAHANNMYVTAENAGAAALIANRTAIDAWETFDLINNSDGTVSLRAHANNMYVTAENAGAAALIANRTAIGSWEKFSLIHNADGSVSLRANANSMYVNASTAPLIANRAAIGSAEEFDLIND